MTVDETDRMILGELRTNGRASSKQLADVLGQQGVVLTSRAVRRRIQRMERDKVILGYSVLADLERLLPVERRILLIKFKTSPAFVKRVSDLVDYFRESQECLFAARLSGDIDLMSCMLFPHRNEGKMECDKIRASFSDIIQDLRSYEVDMVKVS